MRERLFGARERSASDVDGQFKDYKLLIDGDPKQPETLKIKVEIAASSIDTDQQQAR